MSAPTLYYIHDPMCSWCWAFRPARLSLLAQLPKTLSVKSVLGGLAPDSDEPMPAAMQNQLEAVWQRIQTVVPGTEFNFDFWRTASPRRSTYPACRAVIAARTQGEQFEDRMTLAVQEGYYLNALNPSDASTLTAMAATLGLDETQFTADLNSTQTENTLRQEILFGQQIGANGFPSLVLGFSDGTFQPIGINYNAANAMLEQISEHLS